MIEINSPYLYEVIHSARRRTLTLRVLEGRVQVLAPERCSKALILSVVQENSHWITKKLSEQARVVSYMPKRYVTGETFVYLGENYTLNVALGKPMGVMCRDNQLFIFVKPALTEEKKFIDIHKQLQHWYYQQALDYLTQRTKYYAAQLSVVFRTLAVRRFKSQWGSCSVDGDLQYNWRIILAPPPIVDYLVVHELSHIKHHNHSARFWRLVESMVPDYKACKKWLNSQGHLLRID